MTPHWWLGFSAVVLIVVFAVFAFRQGFKVTPDRKNKKFGSVRPWVGMDGSE